MTPGTKERIRESISELLSVSKILRNIRIDLETALQDDIDAFREYAHQSRNYRAQEYLLECLGDMAEAIEDLRRIDLTEIALFLKSIIE